jgi:SAM-dependent methyltransferase
MAKARPRGTVGWEDPAAYEAYRTGPFHDRRVEIIVEAARSVPNLSTGAELGCGTGKTLFDVAARFADVRFDGIDLEPHLIDYARAQHHAPNLEFHAGDASKPVPKSYDFVFSVDFIHHLANPYRCLAQVGAALRPGGRWLMIEPNFWYLPITVSQERMKRAGLGEDHVFPWRIEPAIEAAFLRIVRKRHMHFLPMVASKLGSGLPAIEHYCERWPPLGVSVVYLIEEDNDEFRRTRT